MLCTDMLLHAAKPQAVDRRVVKALYARTQANRAGGGNRRLLPLEGHATQPCYHTCRVAPPFHPLAGIDLL